VTIDTTTNVVGAATNLSAQLAADLDRPLRISVPDGVEPMAHLLTGSVPHLMDKVTALSNAVYGTSTLPLREFEAARVRIAQINGCLVCQNWRSARDIPNRSHEEIPEEWYSHLHGALEWTGYTERERLAYEFAGRFAEDHHSMDDDFWTRMHAEFSDDEIVELTVCTGAWMFSGRMLRIFGVDAATCRIH
jgi:alkylhydroperoxidase family enzyme